MRWGGRGPPFLLAGFALGVGGRGSRGGTGGARMLGARFRSGCIAAVVVLSLTTPLVAQGIDIEAAWRQMFERPASPPPSPPTTRSPPKGSRWARGCLPTRASPAAATAPARAATGPSGPSRTGAGGRSALSGAPLRRNTPSLWNLAWGKHFFWDGRAPSLEAQVRMPIEAAAGDGRRLADDPAAARGGRGLVAPVPRRPSRRSPPVSQDSDRRRRSPPTCARSSRRRPGSMPGSTATRSALRPAEVRGFRPVHRQGRMRALPRRLALHRRPLPRHRPARAATAAAARCRAARRGCRHSRRRACASSRTRRPTCTTARWRRWRPWSGTTPAASSRGRRWRPTSTAICA